MHKAKLYFLTLVIAAGTCLMTACPKPEQDARDAGAALNGAIAAAQAKYQAQCSADTKLQVCTIINQAVSGQNALITATETYCGWSTAAPPPDPTATCVPVASAKSALIAAIANANSLTLELKGAL
jgi:hypothetical protein